QLPHDRMLDREDYTGLRANLKMLRPFVRGHWRAGMIGGAMLLGCTLLSYPQPLINRYLIDTVLIGRNLDLLFGVLMLLAGLFLTHKILGILQSHYITRFEQDVILDIQEDLFNRALRFPKAVFDTTQTGYLMSRLSSDVQGLSWFFSGSVLGIAENVLRFAGGVVLLLYIEWRLAIGVLILIPPIILGIRYFSNRMHVLSHHTMEQQAAVSSRLEESLSTFSLIKSFSTETRTIKRLVSEMKKVLHLSLEQSALTSVASLAIDAVPGIARFSVLALGAYWVVQGEWTLGSLFAFQAYMGYVFGPAQFLAHANLQLQNARASLERVSALYEIVPEENLGTGKRVDRLHGEVEFRHVFFSYDSREPVLNDVSFSVKPGERIAIVGPSGVGKTTLLSLLLRFYKPNYGEIYFDKVPAYAYDVSSLRQRIGYVSQSTQLLTGTVMENLRYGNGDAQEEDVIRAATAAGLHDFVSSLPAGYDTLIGERGANLSEGQKQRLSIARALVKKPDILILDEPTSALDTITEASIFSSLPSLISDKTTFVVAHRLSTIKDSDCVLVLNENRLIASGSHPALLEANEYYRSLFGYQGSDYKTKPHLISVTGNKGS
ncbi:MAG: transporter transrane region, partial [Deltaproteobacteria bacterium]|nr:transporter transrane region [Deltaproteobacteria bacterium]